jgi:hypothetical protein
MATGTAGTTARRSSLQMVHYLRFDVNYNDTSISTGVPKQTLPAGAIITSTSVLVTTTFNAQTTNVLTVGTNGTTANNMVASGDVDETTAALTNAIKPTSAALGKLAADVPVYVKFTQTGTAATQGAATVIVHYVPNNDL